MQYLIDRPLNDSSKFGVYFREGSFDKWLLWDTFDTLEDAEVERTWLIQHPETLAEEEYPERMAIN